MMHLQTIHLVGEPFPRNIFSVIGLCPANSRGRFVGSFGGLFDCHVGGRILSSARVAPSAVMAAMDEEACDALPGFETGCNHGGDHPF